MTVRSAIVKEDFPALGLKKGQRVEDIHYFAYDQWYVPIGKDGAKVLVDEHYLEVEYTKK